MTWYS